MTNTNTSECPDCHGKGTVYVQVQWSDGLGGATATCSLCDGTGKINILADLRKWIDLELFLVGLIMAGTVYCDGPQIEDPTENFDLWRESWDTAVYAWDLSTRDRSWCAVGMLWEYHGEASWRDHAK